MFRDISWAGVVTCFTLYCIVFLAVRYEMEMENVSHTQSRLGLLMFTLPGAIAALNVRRWPLGVALLGALLATPLCLLLIRLHFFSSSVLMQELAFMTSAVFWCGSGALGVMLCRMLLPARD
ncbi:inner membrane protein YbjM [Erwinia sp. P6884]|uniref:inner membrane protein YbjM n=1 Tax=Erwinia sp. P6884 TaxID=3141450 RepID=UPI003191D097